MRQFNEDLAPLGVIVTGGEKIRQFICGATSTTGVGTCETAVKRL